MIADTTDTLLARKLKDTMRRDGPIAVSSYMAACLTDSEHGYYTRQRPIGAAGDFITAPEISQVFGELLGLWSAVVWRAMGAPGAINLVEIGPGRGTLMSDALRAGRRVPGFADALWVHLVDTSEPMMAEQRRLLAALPRVRWHASPAALPKGPTIVLANELLDALPVTQVVGRNGRWHVRQVGLDAAERFTFVTGPECAEPPLAHRPATVHDGDVLEIATGARDMLEALVARTGGGPLAILAIDYGHETTAFGDTLQGVSRHAYCSPFEAPGEVDLTTQVDFQQIATIAGDLGLAIDGPLIQAELLGRLGIMERASRLMSANPARAAAIEAGVARLMAPNGMGSRFKAIGLRSRGLPPLPGFGV